jgi:hypothetical protein
LISSPATKRPALAEDPNEPIGVPVKKRRHHSDALVEKKVEKKVENKVDANRDFLRNMSDKDLQTYYDALIRSVAHAGLEVMRRAIVD